MASRRISTVNRGFTLLEMLVVIGLVAMLGGAVLFVDLGNYRGDAFRAERDTLITLIGQARIDALNNIAEERHGIALSPADAPNSYVVFTGTSYATSDPATRNVFPMSYNATFALGSPSEIVFEQLSGNANFSGTIRLEDPNRDFYYDVAINSEGGLSW